MYLYYFFTFFLINLFLAALGHCCCARAFSSCGERGLLFVAVCRLLIAVASLVVEHRLQAHGLQQLWHMGSTAQAQQLWHTGLVAPRHVGSSRTRARTRVPCTGRRILNHCATREVPYIILSSVNPYSVLIYQVNTTTSRSPSIHQVLSKSCSGLRTLVSFAMNMAIQIIGFGTPRVRSWPPACQLKYETSPSNLSPYAHFM